MALYIKSQTTFTWDKTAWNSKEQCSLYRVTVELDRLPKELIE